MDRTLRPDMLPCVAIFGGSFNPVHIGHIRLVIEVLEALAPKRFDLLPSARPPHKGGGHILPFALRAEMLRAATRDFDKVRVNTMESEREGPSFTVDTLAMYAEREPRCRHCFIIGAEDFSQMRSWHEWERLPQLADILVVPRAGSGREVFTETVRELWPHSTPIEPPRPALNAAYALPGALDEGSNAGLFLHLPMPRLDIRAELIRTRMLADRSIRFLVPDAVYDILHSHPEAMTVWAQEAANQ